MRAVSDVLLARGAPNGNIISRRRGVAGRGVPEGRRGIQAEAARPSQPTDWRSCPAASPSWSRWSRCWASRRMRVADGALREGLLYDLLGRLTDEDARVRSVRAMEARYHVDTAQADRVEATALGLPAPGARGVEARRAARGTGPRAGPRGCTRSGSTSPTAHYHRHGAYLLRACGHARLPARGAAAAGRGRRRASPQAQPRAARGPRAAVAPQGRVPDRAAAARGAAASRARAPCAAARSNSRREGGR